MANHLHGQSKYLDKEGYISFFSKAPVEDIESYNNQVFSLMDMESKEIKVQLLIKSFLFEKALMREHFNENYMESHKYPKAIFKGKIENIEELGSSDADVFIRGVLTIRNIEKQVNLEAKAKRSGENIILKGEFTVLVKDFDIKIPMAVINNIAEEIQVQFQFEHKPYH